MCHPERQRGIFYAVVVVSLVRDETCSDCRIAKQRHRYRFAVESRGGPRTRIKIFGSESFRELASFLNYRFEIRLKHPRTRSAEVRLFGREIGTT